jgi:hypothetical protein
MRPSKALIDHWNTKLAESGFVDIEDNAGKLKQWTVFSEKRTQRLQPDNYAQHQAFYTQARQFLHDYTFDSLVERDVWALYSEGTSIRKLAQKFQLPRCRITLMVNNLTKIMRQVHGNQA